MAPKAGQGEDLGRISSAGKGFGKLMQDVLRTNDPVLLDFARVLLADAGIEAVIFDGHMSVMDGSLGLLPRRLMVSDEDAAAARRVLKEALPEQVPPDP
jgi:hypothetical protein